MANKQTKKIHTNTHSESERARNADKKPEREQEGQ